MKELLSGFFDRVAEVCPVPAAAQRVLVLTADADVDLREAVRVIATDPALAAAVMRIANSSVYSRGVKVSRLEQAVMRIGFRELHQMAAAMALLAAFRSKDEFSLQVHDLAVVSGGVARCFATETKLVDAGTAFLCGLMCEIGAMACLAVDAKPYVKLWQESGGSVSTRVAAEIERYGVTSFEIGARFLLRHNLPAEVCDAVRASLTDTPPQWSDLARTMLMARHAAPAIIRAAESGDLTRLESELLAVAEPTGFAAMGGPRLRELSVRGGLVAEEALRLSR